MLELCSNVRLERYRFVYSYLIRLILEELEKKGGIAYLSLSAKRLSCLSRDPITSEL